ncbi:MAG: alcohol dehydrogenase catalytic domain-containing protein [Anaerolineales bacterium]
MRTLVYTGPRQLELQDAPLPTPEADEVVIRVAYAGICGSELSGYLGHNALREPLLVMGHEFAGQITALDATDSRGVRVAVDAVGAATTRKQCVAGTRSTGTLMLSGLHEETSAMPAAEIIRREIVVRGSFAYAPANIAEELQRLADGTMRLDPWIVEALLADGGEWFERLADAPGDVAKVLLVP